MSFAIEVPGEAVPLNPHELLKALHGGTSTNNSQRQSASKQLEEWESHHEYYVALQSAFLDKSLPIHIRTLATILFKNGVDKYWRVSAAMHAIKPPQKAQIRARLLQGTVDEEDRGIALQNAVATAKIVRLDYPQEWPEIFPALIEVIRNTRNGNQAHLSGALTLLLQIVKEMAVARLRRSQTTLQQVAPEIVQLAAEIYAEKTQMWLEFLTRGVGDEDDADYAMQSSLTALRTVRRLLIDGFEDPHQNEIVQQFWTLSQNHFGQFLGHVSHDSAIPAPYQDVVGKHLLQFTKLHIAMADRHPASFVLLPTSIPLVHAYWDLVARFAEVFDKSGGIKTTTVADAAGSKSKVDGPLLERLALQGLLLLMSCISIATDSNLTFKYRNPKNKEEQTQAVNHIKTTLLTHEFVRQLVNIIVTKLFIFRKSDLDAWEEDPQDYELQTRDDGDAWQWQVRLCAERVFIKLLIKYADLLRTPLLAYFHTASSAEADIVPKEAVYTAMGASSTVMNQTFDFDTFLVSNLVKDVQMAHPLAKLLRRRAALLLGSWVPVGIKEQSQPVVFEIFRHLLNKTDEHNDDVVRITAARQFKIIANDFNFKKELVKPYIHDILSLLIGLLTDVEAEETQIPVLETIRVIVERMDTDISQLGDDIMNTLPRLWASSEAEAFMIKQSILSIISALITSMKAESQRYLPNILSLIKETMNPQSAWHTSLLEEAVELWNTFMQQSTVPISPELAAMEELALPLLEYSSILADSGLEIVRSYIILAPETMLTDRFRRPTLTALGKAMESKSREHVVSGSRAMQFFIRAAQQLGGLEGVTVIIQDLLEIGFLPRVIKDLHEAFEAHGTTGPKAKASKLTVSAETEYFNILSQLVLADPDLFVKMLSQAGDVVAIWGWLSKEWFSFVERIPEVDHQKLSCLALTRMTELPQPMQNLALAKLQDYCTMWSRVIADTQDGDPTRADLLVWHSLPEDAEWDTPLYRVEKGFIGKDAVHTEDTKVFVTLRLQNLVERAGGLEAYTEHWVANVDTECYAEFARWAGVPNAHPGAT